MEAAARQPQAPRDGKDEQGSARMEIEQAKQLDHRSELIDMLNEEAAAQRQEILDLKRKCDALASRLGAYESIRDARDWRIAVYVTVRLDRTFAEAGALVGVCACVVEEWLVRFRELVAYDKIGEPVADVNGAMAKIMTGCDGCGIPLTDEEELEMQRLEEWVRKTQNEDISEDIEAVFSEKRRVERALAGVA